MTKQQVGRASTHDWYHYCGMTTNNPLKYTVWVYSDGVGSELIAFSDYQELRDWAGY